MGLEKLNIQILSTIAKTFAQKKNWKYRQQQEIGQKRKSFVMSKQIVELQFRTEK